MGDPTSTLIFSIDPGIVNVGVALYDYANKNILFSGKLTLAPSLKAIGGEAKIVPRVFKLFFDDNNSPYKKMINNSKIVLIENQMKRKMLLVQHSIASFCFAGNIDYTMVDPRSVKAHFDIGSYARKRAGTSVKGKKNHHVNKKMAILKIQEICPDIFTNVTVSKQDDIADAVLQAIWYGDGLVPKTRKRRREKT
jgi:hypothetical protein